MEATFLLTLLITFLASFIGYELISKIPQTLHTPLMSGSNAISGITLIAAILIYPEVDESQLLKIILLPIFRHQKSNSKYHLDFPRKSFHLRIYDFIDVFLERCRKRERMDRSFTFGYK